MMPTAIAERVLRMVNDQAVVSVSGKTIKMPVDTICVHGDTPGAVAIARQVRERAREERPPDRAVRQEQVKVSEVLTPSAARGSLALTVSLAALCASIRFSSGMHEPQFVPAFSDAPIAATEHAPPLIASPIVLRPTPKQAQTIGPAPASPSPLRPDSSMRRSSAVTASFSNSALTASHSTASSKAPLNRQSSMRSFANAAAR